MATAKCPKCEKVLTSIKMEEVTIRGSDTRTWHGVVYSCPYCRTAISTGIDPVALKTDTVLEVARRLGK